jgi:ketosteroid isomerase-like protein
MAQQIGSAGVSEPEDQPEALHPAGDAAAVATVNRRFYEAFEAADLDAMSDLWEHSDRASCVHPGWAVLRGWSAVAAGWAALFQGPQRLQFILTNEQVTVHGGTAWVTVDENIIGPDSGAVAAVNIFVRADPADDPLGGWRMVAHHGSAIAAHQHPPDA